MFMKHCLKFEWTHSNFTELTKLELSESEDFDYVCQKLGQYNPFLAIIMK